MPRRALTSIAITALLALAPATAFADGGAGDNQYQDPLAAPAPTNNTKKKTTTTTTPATSTPATTSAPAASTAPASTSSPSSASPSSSSKELPRTGTPAGLIGLGGAGLIALGTVLRRRTITQ